MHITRGTARGARAVSDLRNGVLDLLRSIPTGVTWDGRDALFELNMENVRYVRTHFPDATWDEQLEGDLKELEERITRMRERAEAKYRPMLESEDGWEYKRAPFQHQRKAFVLGRDLPGFMYFMEPGTGKTKVTADTAAYLYEQGKIGGLLILAENGMHLQWPEELAKDIPDRVPWKHVIFKSSRMEDVGSLKDDRKPTRRELELLSLISDFKGLKVLCMNIEALSHDKGKEWALWFVQKQPTLTVVDESQLIGVPGSVRTRNAWAVGRKSEYRRILTGTPVAEGVERLYSQCLFTDFRILETSRYSQFKDRYCKLWGKWNKIVGYKNLDDLTARIDPYSFAIEKKDCVDLPPQLFERVTVEMSTEQARLYKELKDEFVAELQGGSYVQAEVTIARLVKLQQITSGFVRANDKSLHYLGSENRLTAAVDIADRARRKVVIWCAFKPDVVLVEKALKERGIESALYYGGVTVDECKANLERWRRPDGPKVFLATLKKAVRGLTLNEADTVVYYSHTWSNEARTQSLARNYRIGQDVPVTVFDLVVPGTIDVKILRSLEKKENIKNLVSSPKAVLEWILD